MSKTIKDPENIISWAPNDPSSIKTKLNFQHDDGKSILKPHVVDLNIHERINIRSWMVASTDPYARLRRVSVKTHNELLAIAIIAGRPNRYSRKGVSRAS